MDGQPPDGDPDRGSEPAGEPDEPAVREADDPDVGPWPVRALTGRDPDPPPLVAAIGQLGEYLGVAAVALAIVGLVAGFLDLRIAANVAIFFALASVSVAMGMGVVYQIYVVRG